MHNARIEPQRSMAHANTHYSRLSHAGIYFHEIDGIIMTPDRPWAAARQMRLVMTQLSHHWLSFQPSPSSTTTAANHHQHPPIVHQYPLSMMTMKLPGKSHSPPPLTENHNSTGCECHITQLDEQPPQPPCHWAGRATTATTTTATSSTKPRQQQPSPQHPPIATSPTPTSPRNPNDNVR